MSSSRTDPVLPTNGRHTPGPWVADISGAWVETSAIVTKGRTHGYGCGDNFVCSLNDGEYHEYSDGAEQVANARLIAASPCLLEALRQARADLLTLHDWIAEETRQTCRIPMSASMIKRADAAITKATGGDQ